MSENFLEPNPQSEHFFAPFLDSENSDPQDLATFSAENNQDLTVISTPSDDDIILPQDSSGIIRQTRSLTSEGEDELLGKAAVSVDAEDELLNRRIQPRNGKNRVPGSNKRKAFNIGTLTEDFEKDESVGRRDAKDFYKLKVKEKTEVEIKLTGLTGNADLYLLPEKGNKVIDKSKKGGKKDEEISASLEAGTYYLQVKPRNRRIRNADYNLSLEIVEPADNFTVTSPNGGEKIKAGSTVDITWDSDTEEKVDISLMKNEEWDSFIDVDVSSRGSYSWEVPENLEVGNKYQVLVETSDSLDSETINFDNSDGFFKILEAEKIAVTSLNGGEIIEPGEKFEITWDDNIDDKVNIKLFQGDELVETIASDIPSNGSYSWEVAESVAEGNGYQILIESAVNDEIADKSDGFFAVAIPAPITVTSPNGGESLRLGQEYEITWDDNIEGNVTIELYGEDPTTLIYGEYPIVIASDIPSNGSYTWDVDYFDLLESTEDNYKIKIRSVDGEFEDESDDFFNIIFDPDKYFQVLSPNGGETLAQGSTVEISWTHNISDAELASNGDSSIAIQLRDENGRLGPAGRVPASDYSYNWEVPTYLNGGKGGKYKMYIRGHNNYVTTQDTSDDFFTIAPRDYLNVTDSILGVYEVGDKIDIEWEDNLDGNVVIELYDNVGVELKQTITDSTPSDGLYTWTVPNNLQEDFYRIKVRSLDGKLADETTIFSVDGFGSHISSAIFKGGPLAQSITQNWSEADWNIAKNAPVSVWEHIEEGGQTAWQAIGDDTSPLGVIQVLGNEISEGGKTAWEAIAAGGDTAWQALGKGGFTTGKALDLFQKHHPKGETAWATIATGGDDAWEALNKGGLNAWKALNHVTKPKFRFGSPSWSNRWKGSKPTGWDAITRLGQSWVDNAWDTLKDEGIKAWNNLSKNPTTWLVDDILSDVEAFNFPKNQQWKDFVPGISYDPDAMEVGVRIPEAYLRQAVAAIPEQKLKDTDFNKITAKGFEYKGINVAGREVVVGLRTRYQHYEDFLLGMAKVYDNTADMQLGLNLEVVDGNLQANANPKKVKLGWGSGILGIVHSGFDALFGTTGWLLFGGDFVRMTDIFTAFIPAAFEVVPKLKELTDVGQYTDALDEISELNKKNFIQADRTDYDQHGVWVKFKLDKSKFDDWFEDEINDFLGIDEKVKELLK